MLQAGESERRCTRGGCRLTLAMTDAFTGGLLENKSESVLARSSALAYALRITMEVWRKRT
jgi:hypothetical protein